MTISVQVWTSKEKTSKANLKVLYNAVERQIFSETSFFLIVWGKSCLFVGKDMSTEDVNPGPVLPHKIHQYLETHME